MIRECFIVEDGVRYSEVDGGEMLVSFYGLCSFPPPWAIEDGKSKYPYVLKSKESEYPKNHIRIIDGKLYFLLNYKEVGKCNEPDRWTTKTKKPVWGNGWKSVKEIGYIVVDEYEQKPDAYLLYWHPLTKEMLHD